MGALYDPVVLLRFLIDRPWTGKVRPNIANAEGRLVTLRSSLLFPPPSGDSRIQLAYSDRRRPLAFGEPQSQSVARIQMAFIRLGFSMPRSNKSGGLDGIFGNETLSIVREFQRRNGLRADGMVGQHTLDRLDELLLVLPPSPPGPAPTPPPTHDSTIKEALLRSRNAVGFALRQLRLLEGNINTAVGLDGNAKIIAIQALGRAHARNIAVIAKRLFVGDPLSAEFRAALHQAIGLIDKNSRESSTIIDGGSTGRCDATLRQNKGRVPFAASTQGDPDPRVSACNPFFASSDDLQRDVLTHEFFHLVGLADVENSNTTEKALNNANTLAQIVAWINDRNRQVNSDGNEAAVPPLPAP